MKFKYLIVLSLALTAAALKPAVAKADILDDLKHATNYTGVVYGTHFDANDKWGGGAMVLYNFNGFVGAGVGADWAGQWRLFTGNLNVHYSYQISDRLSLTGYGIAALGSSSGGAGSDNGAAATGEGGGAYLSYRFTDKLTGGVGANYITRQNVGAYSGGSEGATLALKYSF